MIHTQMLSLAPRWPPTVGDFLEGFTYLENKSYPVSQVHLHPATRHALLLLDKETGCSLIQENADGETLWGAKLLPDLGVQEGYLELVGEVGGSDLHFTYPMTRDSSPSRYWMFSGYKKKNLS